jgi:hypothetical protein
MHSSNSSTWKTQSAQWFAYWNRRLTCQVEANNTLIDGRHIRIEQAKVNRTLFLAKFSRMATKDEIQRILERFGPVEEFNILKNYQTGISKVFSFRHDSILTIGMRIRKIQVSRRRDPCVYGVARTQQVDLRMGVEFGAHACRVRSLEHLCWPIESRRYFPRALA